MSDADAKQLAFKAIQDETEKLLQKSLPDEVQQALERIISISRYQIDVRTAVEQNDVRV